MTKKEIIIKEMISLYEDGAKLAQSFKKKDKKNTFHYDYQNWYTKALRIIEILASDRYNEFKSYYEIDPKRKVLAYGNYVIQDYLKGIMPSIFDYDVFDEIKVTSQNFLNQLTILYSVIGRAESVLENIDIELLSEIQDLELHSAEQLLKINIRAAGSLSGVILESHLQKIAKKHGIIINKKNPTISELNDPLRNSNIYGITTWRKITYLGDIRNLCSHKKDIEPNKDQVSDLIEGTNWVIKNVQ